MCVNSSDIRQSYDKEKNIVVFLPGFCSYGAYLSVLVIFVYLITLGHAELVSAPHQKGKRTIAAFIISAWGADPLANGRHDGFIILIQVVLVYLTIKRS